MSKKRYSRAYVEITNICNRSCSFCPGTKRENRRMTAEEFAHICNELKPLTDYIYFHVMGEPLLHPQLEEILRIAADLNFKICLTTNGTLLHRALPTLLSARNLHKISVSLHSFEGNDGVDGLDEYVAQATRACVALTQQGVICAFRLWNEGGKNEKNAQIFEILSREFDIYSTVLSIWSVRAAISSRLIPCIQYCT